MKRVLLGLFAAMTLSTPGWVLGQATPVAPPAVEEAAPQTSSDLPKARVAGRTPGASSAASSAPATKTGNYQNSVPPLIVQFSKTDQNHIGLLEDDLSVMSVIMDRALERALGEDSPDYKMGIPMTLSSGSRSVRAMYIEGLGALFMVKVNFPVMPPPVMEEKKIEPAQNSDWDKARNEIYGQDEQIWTGDMPPASGGEYNSAQVEALKKELLQSLKNASNIQDLKPEEFITITVFGSPGVVRQTVSVEKRGGASASSRKKANENANENVFTTEDDFRPAGQARRFATDLLAKTRNSATGTVLTMRVRKSDVDSFANGALAFEDFQKKASFNAYPGRGHGMTSLNSWVQKGRSQRK